MKLRYRTVWISDAHLGSKGARAEELSRFLKHVRCEQLYLVGDIIDMWRLKSRWYWPAAHNDVVRRVLKMASKGTKVVLVPGNHDDAARQYLGMDFGGVRVEGFAEHECVDGKRLFVTHGDQFDLIVTHSKMLSVLGGWAYDQLLVVNRFYNAGRKRLGMPYASLSQAIKGKVKRACTFVSKFEAVLLEEAERRGMDGVVCGHIHKAEHSVGENGLIYLNCGDWVESLTALVEYADGRIEIVDGVKVIEEFKARRRERRAAGHAEPVEDETDALDEDDALVPDYTTRDFFRDWTPSERAEALVTGPPAGDTMGSR